MKPIRIKTAQSKRAWMALACEQGRVIEAQRRQLDAEALRCQEMRQALDVAMGRVEAQRQIALERDVAKRRALDLDAVCCEAQVLADVAEVARLQLATLAGQRVALDVEYSALLDTLKRTQNRADRMERERDAARAEARELIDIARSQVGDDLPTDLREIVLVLCDRVVEDRDEVDRLTKDNAICSCGYERPLHPEDGPCVVRQARCQAWRPLRNPQTPNLYASLVRDLAAFPASGNAHQHAVGLRARARALVSGDPDPRSAGPGGGEVLPATQAEPVTSIDQPPPQPGATAVWPVVIDEMADAPAGLLDLMRERDAVGRVRYGTPLQTNNGRDALKDALAEVLDAVVYLCQARLEGRAVARAECLARALLAGLYEMLEARGAGPKVDDELLARARRAVEEIP